MTHAFQRPSTYMMLVAWAMSGFVAHPSLASMVVWFANFVLLSITLFVAHWEARRELRER